MSNSNDKSPLFRQIQLLGQNATTAMFYLSNEYDKDQIVKLAIELQSQIIKYQDENNKLRGEVEKLLNQQKDRTNNKNISENEFQELQEKLNDTSNRYLRILEQYSNSLKENEEIEKQRKNLEKQTNEYIATLKQQKNEIQQQVFSIQQVVLQIQVEKNPQFPQNQQYQNEFNNFQKNFKEVSVQCSGTIKEIETVIKQVQKDQDDNGIYNQSLQVYQDILAKNKAAKQVIDNLMKKYVNFRQTLNITDVQINNILDNHERTLQLYNVIMTKFENILIQMYKDMINLEKKNKKLQYDNNKLNERIKEKAKINKQEIDNQQLIIQSIKQSQNVQNVNVQQKNKLFVNFNKLKELLKFSNEQFYEILLMFISQGLTIRDLQLNQQDQNQVAEIIKNIQLTIKQEIPKNFQELQNFLNKCIQFFNGLKQYINDRNNLIQVINIQDKFFKNYEKTISNFIEIEKIKNLIDQGVTIGNR